MDAEYGLIAIIAKNGRKVQEKIYASGYFLTFFVCQKGKWHRTVEVSQLSGARLRCPDGELLCPGKTGIQAGHNIQPRREYNGAGCIFPIRKRKSEGTLLGDRPVGLTSGVDWR